MAGDVCLVRVHVDEAKPGDEALLMEGGYVEVRGRVGDVLAVMGTDGGVMTVEPHDVAAVLRVVPTRTGAGRRS